MSRTGNAPPGRRRRASRTHRLRERGLTWERIADVWEADYPDISPRVAFRWAHNLTHQEVAERWNLLDSGEPVMTKSRIYEYEVWPQKGRRPSVHALRTLARIYQTTGRRLLSADEYATYDDDSRSRIGKIDDRILDPAYRPNAIKNEPDSPTPTAALFTSLSAASPTPIGIETPQSSDADLAAVQAFRWIDQRTGGGHLYPTVVAYLQAAVAPRIFGGIGGGDKSLFAAAGGLTEMAGWMAHDAGRDGVAWQHFSRSLEFAAAGGDHQLKAHVLASMSHLSLRAGEAHEAIRLAREGHASISAASSSPDLVARLFAMEARGLAMLRRAYDCDKALIRAEEALGQVAAQAPSPWVSPFDEGALAGEAARCMYQLGRLDGAEVHARKVISLRPIHRARSRALGQLVLAAAVIGQGRPEEGCAVAEEVVQAIPLLGSFIVIEQLRSLQVLLAQHNTNKVVAEFLSYVRECYASRFAAYKTASSAVI